MRSFARSNLPFVLLTAAVLVGSVVGVSTGGTPFVVLGSSTVDRAAVVVAALLLSSAIFVGIVECARGRDRRRNALGASLAMLLYVASLGLHTWGAHVSALLKDVESPSVVALAKRGESAWEARNGRAGRALASTAFRELGVRIAYRDEGGAVRIHEPAPDEVAARARERAAQDQSAMVSAVFEGRLESLTWAAYAHIGALATVVLLGCWLVALQRRSTIDPRAA